MIDTDTTAREAEGNQPTSIDFTYSVLGGARFFQSEHPRTPILRSIDEFVRAFEKFTGVHVEPATADSASQPIVKVTAEPEPIGTHRMAVFRSGRLQTAAAEEARRRGKPAAVRARRFDLACVFHEIANSVASPLDSSQTVRPPAALIGHRERKATWEPDQQVVVRNPPLGQLHDPDGAENVTETPQVFADRLLAPPNMVRSPNNLRAVSGRDHRDSIPEATGLELSSDQRGRQR